MSVTIAIDEPRSERISRSLAVVTGLATFDTSYPNGGESCAGIVNKLSGELVVIFEQSQGIAFQWDKTNNKVKAYAAAPPVVFEEKVTCTSKVGYLKYPAAHIDYIVEADANYIPVSGAVTPATGQCAVDLGYNDTTGVLTKGQRTKLTFYDTVTTVYVTYATQAWKDLADNMEAAKVTGVGDDEGLKVYGNTSMVADPVVDADILRIGQDIVAMQSITWGDGGDAGTIKVPELLKDGGTPAATLEMEIDFVKDTTFAEVVCNANDMLEMVAGDTVRLEYIKKPASGFLADRFVNAEIGDSTDTITWTGIPLIYGSCGQIPTETSDKKAYLIKASDTLAAGEANWTSHPWYPGITTAAVPIMTEHSASDVGLSPAWISGHPSELACIPVEVPNGIDLSHVAARFIAIGLWK